MKYVNLGTTGLKVSELCLGTMTFGKEADRRTSEAIYRRCREAGINFFDCANVYSSGEAERILGEIIPEERDRLIVTTKVGGAMGEGPNQDGLSRRHLIQQCEQSLRRLNTGWIDVYFAHRFDTLVPDRGNAARLRHADPAGQGAVSGRQQLGGLADRQGPRHQRPARPERHPGHAAHVQPGEAPGRGRAVPPGARRGHGSDGLQPAGRGRADREIRPHAERTARAGFPRTRCTPGATQHPGCTRRPRD